MKSRITVLLLAALAAPAFAANAPLPTERRAHRIERFERRLDRAVERGKLTPDQAQKLKGEAEQIRAEVESQRAANGGRLSPEQKEHVKSEMHALRDELRANLGKPPAK